MAQSSKTFAGSTLTPSGDAAVSGNALVVAAAASYLDDFESYSIGATPTGMTTVAATATAQSSSGQKVMRVVAASWGGVYYTGATFGDGCFVATALAVGARMNPVARHNAASAKGYPLQLLASFVQMGDSIPTNFVSLNSPLRVQQDGITMPSVPWTTKLQTFTEAGGNVQVRMWLNDVLRFDYLDSIRKWPAGNLAAQAFLGTTDFSAWAFYPVKTGGFTATLTPTSVTRLTRIVVEWDNENSVAKRSSEVFEYRIDGGAWTALPDSGYIDAACTATIGLRAVNTLKNGYDSTGAVTINSVAVEIEGQWDASATGPGTPTGLAVTANSSATATVTWTPGANTDFVAILRSTTNNVATATLVGASASGSFTAHNLTPGTPYYWWAEPFNDTGAGTAAGSVSATQPAAPENDFQLAENDRQRSLITAIVTRLTSASYAGTKPGTLLAELADKGSDTLAWADGDVPVWAGVPKDTKPPFVTVAASEAVPWGTKTRPGNAFTVTVLVASWFDGFDECDRIADAILDALSADPLDLSPDGFQLVLFRPTTNQSGTLEADGRTNFRRMTYRAIVADDAQQDPHA